MQAGKLDNRIIIQSQTGGVDALGQPVDTWANTHSVWAHIKYQNGAQAIKAGADVSVVQVSIRIRRKFGVNAGMRVLYGSTVYQIDAVLHDEADKQYTDLVCKVVT
jgi:SPP1 family predicted phage head-tail adaptor